MFLKKNQSLGGEGPLENEVFAEGLPSIKNVG